MKIFYFTGTGNSLYVAKRIGGELYSIPQMLKEGKREFAAEAIGFVFPCYAFGLPRLVSDFIRKSQFKADYFFAIMTYGNMAASGLKHMEDVGRMAGIQFDYTNEILMIDNYLPMFEMEDQLGKEDSKKIEEKLAQILKDIDDRQKRRINKGVGSRFLSSLVYRFFASRQFDNADKKFIIGDNCNGCRTCEKVCPKKNIAVRERPEFLHKCEGCYACIHLCPQAAIHLKAEKSGARFRNRNVSLREIIEANNQQNCPQGLEIPELLSRVHKELTEK